MQDMDVVKKGSSAWLWILIALAAVALVLWLAMGGTDQAPRTGQLLAPALERMAAMAVLRA